MDIGRLRSNRETSTKLELLPPHCQYLYYRTGQGLKGAPHTYAQYSDLVFEPLPAASAVEAFPTNMFDLLHEKYFPRVVFGPVYLPGIRHLLSRTVMDMVESSRGPDGLRPSVKNRNKILN